MNRVKLLQLIINKGKFKKYLEIGTHKGWSFFPLKCKYKIAVDPSFRISSREKYAWLFKNPYNVRNKYFELTSDDFFQQKENYLKKVGKQDLIFIDGLHTFEASLKDVLNSLKHIKMNGVIMMHDCFPPHEVAAMPLNSFEEGNRNKIKGWNGEWCGDVWKTIVYLKENYTDHLEIYVLDTDFGLGIIKFKTDASLNLEINTSSFNKIKKLDYHNLMISPQDIISLKDKGYVSQLLESI